MAPKAKSSNSPKIAGEVHARIWNASQSWFDERMYKVVLLGVTYTIRTRIRRNAYDDQSHAIVEVLDGLKWSTLSSLDTSLWPLMARTVKYVDRDVKGVSFDSLVGILVNDAYMILG